MVVLGFDVVDLLKEIDALDLLGFDPDMSQKRNPDDAKARFEGNSSEDKRRRVLTFRSVVLEVMRLQRIQNLLEPMLRKVVREEVDLALRKHLSSMKQNDETDGKEVHFSELRSLELKFSNSLSLPVFTGAQIKGVDGSDLKVSLMDALTGQIIEFGPKASSMVEIVVLEGDFDGDENGNWNIEEFKGNILREREGKKPILMGDQFLTLKDGIGLVGEICFTDNSSWTRSRRFRLGARVVEDSLGGIRVKEAKTEPFIVKDHRGELYKKHHPPSLLDEVWRLEKIGKDGAFHKRLCTEKITTVKDFLIQLFRDPIRLRNIIGTGMSAKMWEVTVEHARTCVLDKAPLYLYYYPQGSEQKTGVVFNIVGQVMGLYRDCHYVPVDKLSEIEKADTENMVISASQNWEEVVAFNDPTSNVITFSDPTNALYISNLPQSDGPYGSKILSTPRIGEFDYTHSNMFSPDIISSLYSIGNIGSSLDDYTLENIDSIPVDLRYYPNSGFQDQPSSNSLICVSESLNQTFYDEDHLRYFESDLQCENSSYEPQARLQNHPTAKRRWKKLFNVVNVLKWFLVSSHMTKKT